MGALGGCIGRVSYGLRSAVSVCEGLCSGLRSECQSLQQAEHLAIIQWLSSTYVDLPFQNLDQNKGIQDSGHFFRFVVVAVQISKGVPNLDHFISDLFSST